MEVARDSGVTYRMLDCWVRKGVIRPAVPARGEGSRRRFSDDDAACLKVVARLAALGAKSDVLKRVAETLRTRPELWGRTVVVTRDGAVVWFGAEPPEGWVVRVPSQVRRAAPRPAEVA